MRACWGDNKRKQRECSKAASLPKEAILSGVNDEAANNETLKNMSSLLLL
jgi:hypothetical protein